MSDEPPRFDSIFGVGQQTRSSAPGRVNLIGEHTDYQEGFVLPLALPQRTFVELRAQEGRRVRVFSTAFCSGVSTATFELGQERVGLGWADYVQGAVTALARAGHKHTGFDAFIHSDVPVGAGLASSAALEVALLRAIRKAFGLHLDDVQLARLAQQAETDFVGAPVGIMDQMASSLASTKNALFLDTRSLAFEYVPLPDSMKLLIIDSGVTHNHATGDYRIRRSEAAAAAEALGVRWLRDLVSLDLQRLDSLPLTLARRARHIFNENARVAAAVGALRSGDLRRLGALLSESHASLRDDYEVSIPELDLLVEMGHDSGQIYGARMTGGGFGGSVVFLVLPDADPGLGESLARAYAQATNRVPRVLLS